MSKKLQMIMLALGLSVVLVFVGCSSDDDDNGPTITAPNAPTNVIAAESDTNTVVITWTESALDEAPDGYAIERSVEGGTYVEIGSVEAGVSMFVDDDIMLGSGYTYEYQIGAYNGGGTTWSDVAEVTVRTFTEWLIGFWAADPASQGMMDLGLLASTYQLGDGGTLRHDEEYEDFHPLDTEIWEEGFYSADASTITFHVLETDEGVADTTFTWNYTGDFPNGEFTLSHSYAGDSNVYPVTYYLPVN